MEKDLCKFMEKVKMINKELSTYRDEEKGIIFPLNTVHLLPRLDYLELDKVEYTNAKFQKKIEDLDYKIGNVKRPVPKNEITKKEEDKYTLIDKEVAVRKVWNISNSVGAYKSFTKKDDAIAFFNKLYDEVMEKLLNV